MFTYKGRTYWNWTDLARGVLGCTSNFEYLDDDSWDDVVFVDENGKKYTYSEVDDYDAYQEPPTFDAEPADSLHDGNQAFLDIVALMFK